MTQPHPAGPLSGLVVADFSRVLAGPLATMMLADLGARVIKVERPDGGDDTRSWGPPYHHDLSTYYLALNRNKRSVTLDLKDPADLGRARTLARRADVLVENFRPGTMARFGLSDADLRAENPGLIYCSISGFGAGSGADLPGYDLLIQATGGLMSLTGDPATGPTKAGVAIIDIVTGLHATTGVLAALQERTRSGRGQLIEVSLLNSALNTLLNHASAFLCTGTVPVATGNAHPSIAPYQTFATANGTLVLAVGTDAQFTRLCQVLGRPELAADPRFRTNPARVEHRDALTTELTAALAAAPATDWARRLTAVSVPAGPVHDVSAAFQFAESLGLAPAVRPGPDWPPMTRNPLSLSRTPVQYRSAPPRLGEHHTEVVAWLDETEDDRVARDPRGGGPARAPDGVGPQS
ncbi:MAG TPA: CoA transferase [Micromonosporaceae bacterium]